jgi:hypothetical protein
MAKKCLGATFVASVLIVAGLWVMNRKPRAQVAEENAQPTEAVAEVARSANLNESKTEGNIPGMFVAQQRVYSDDPDHIISYNGQNYTEAELEAAYPGLLAVWASDEMPKVFEDTALFTIHTFPPERYEDESIPMPDTGVQINGTMNKVGIEDTTCEAHPEDIPLLSTLTDANYNADRDQQLIESGYQFKCAERYWRVLVGAPKENEDSFDVECNVDAGSTSCGDGKFDGAFIELWRVQDGELKLLDRRRRGG